MANINERTHKPRVRKIKPNTIYRYFTGKYFYVLEVVTDHSGIPESQEPKTFVVYRELYGSYKLRVMELNEFRGEMDSNMYPNAKQKYKFEEIRATFETLFGATYKIVYKDKTKCVINYTNWENVRRLVIDGDSIGYYDIKNNNESLPITNDIWVLAEIIRAKELNIKPSFKALETILAHLEMNRNRGINNGR